MPTAHEQRTKEENNQNAQLDASRDWFLSDA
jgi:hypothetical protein